MFYMFYVNYLQTIKSMATKITNRVRPYILTSSTPRIKQTSIMIMHDDKNTTNFVSSSF